MSKKPEDLTDEQIEDKKKAAKKSGKYANKQKQKNSNKKAADKMLQEIAADVPLSAGGGKEFLRLNLEHDKLDEKKEELNAARRAVRSKLKAMKVDLPSLDRVRKLRAMDPEDRMAKKVTEDLYEKELGLELTPSQKERMKELEKRRESSRKALIEANGGDTGKEIGSGVQFGAKTDPQVVNAPQPPQKNEALAAGYRAAPIAH